MDLDSQTGVFEAALYGVPLPNDVESQAASNTTLPNIEPICFSPQVPAPAPVPIKSPADCSLAINKILVEGLPYEPITWLGRRIWTSNTCTVDLITKHGILTRLLPGWMLHRKPLSSSIGA